LRAYPSSQKGGTLIAEDVGDLAAHEQRLRAPDRYRPSACGRCGGGLHVHDLRPRLMLGDAQVATEVIRFRCADRPRCGAVWQIVPAFLARYLWRTWPVVQSAAQPDEVSVVPERTRRRWRTRLASSARVLVAVLADTGRQVWTAIAMAVGLDGSRLDLAGHYARAMRPAAHACMAELAALFHRLIPGMRLM
jgi:hypothetical protein